jgi:hypothetical protein
MFLRISKWVLIVAVLIQLIPYGRNHTNPPVTKEPAWDSPGTRELFRRACFDCHSKQTVWPWYARVAPVSWLVQNDVDGGRGHLNFSQWDRQQHHAPDVAAQVKQGDMPLWYYRPMHPAAGLSNAEKQELMDGAQKTLGPQKAGEGGE